MMTDERVSAATCCMKLHISTFYNPLFILLFFVLVLLRGEQKASPSEFDQAFWISDVNISSVSSSSSIYSSSVSSGFDVYNLFMQTRQRLIWLPGNCFVSVWGFGLLQKERHTQTRRQNHWNEMWLALVKDNRWNRSGTAHGALCWCLKRTAARTHVHHFHFYTLNDFIPWSCRHDVAQTRCFEKTKDYCRLNIWMLHSWTLWSLTGEYADNTAVPEHRAEDAAGEGITWTNWLCMWTGCSWCSLPEHVTGIKSSQPVTVGVSVVVAGSSTVTFDEGNLPEVFQTGSGGG